MKKSNKLLIAGFLMAILLITAVHLTIYAKYRKGDYSIYKEDLSGALISFPNINFVVVRDLDEANVSFGEQAGIDKNQSDFDYARKGDTLLITGKEPSSPRGMHYPAAFVLPYRSGLSLYNSTVSIVQTNGAAVDLPGIYLQRSAIGFRAKGAPLQFSNIRIVASDNSIIDFGGAASIGGLKVQLANSNFSYNSSDPRELSIITDSVSHLSIQAKTLSKAKIKFTE